MVAGSARRAFPKAIAASIEFLDDLVDTLIHEQARPHLEAIVVDRGLGGIEDGPTPPVADIRNESR